MEGSGGLARARPPKLVLTVSTLASLCPIALVIVVPWAGRAGRGERTCARRTRTTNAPRAARGLEPRSPAEAAAEGIRGRRSRADRRRSSRIRGSDRVANPWRRLEGLVEDRPGVAGVVGPRRSPPRPAGVVVSEGETRARTAVIFDEEPIGGPAIDRLRLEDAMPGRIDGQASGGAEPSYAGHTRAGGRDRERDGERSEAVAIGKVSANLACSRSSPLARRAGPPARRERPRGRGTWG